MANTKLTKRKEEGNTQQVESYSDSEAELPQNQGNGDLVVDNLSHVHNKCDNLMAKLKAQNQAAEDIPTASVENLSKVAATADATSESLINYLTGNRLTLTQLLLKLTLI